MIIKEHLLCYSTPLTPLIVMSFLVCKGYTIVPEAIAFTKKKIVFFTFVLQQFFCLVCDKSNSTRYRSRHSNFFRSLLDVIAFDKIGLTHFSQLKSRIFQEKTLLKFVPDPTVSRKIIGLD